MRTPLDGFGLFGLLLCIVGLLGLMVFPLPILVAQGVEWFWTAEWPSWSLWSIVVQPATTLGWYPVDWFWRAPLALSVMLWFSTMFMVGFAIAAIVATISEEMEPIDINRPWGPEGPPPYYRRITRPARKWRI